MIGFLFAFLSAFSVSIETIFSKKSVKNINEYLVAWSLRFFAALFLIPLLLFIEIPELNNQFWTALLVSGGLKAITTVLFIKALKYSDISIVSPIIAFTPLFLLITSPLIIGEFPKTLGFIGILLIVVGSYFLKIKEKKKGYLIPFKALFKERGAQLVIIVAFLWSITSNFDKIGVQNSSPIFWAVSANIFISLVLFPAILTKPRRNLKQITGNFKTLVPMALFSALALVFQMIAIELILVVYVISIKRLSILMNVLWGYLIFKEKGIKERLVGTVIMIAGIFLIALFG
ncbi:MAG: EamA family transporter [Candidatus Pacebacteria bacterium]|nr:EamA family transporter [Candidatus Paceibacterota bacterium]